VKEDLMFQERVLEPKVDGIFSRIYNTSQGVVQGGGRVPNTTAGFEVIHTFATGVAGAFRNLPGGGDQAIDTAITGQVQMYNPSTAFPAVADAVAPGYVQKKLQLIEGLGLFVLPLHLILAEALDATIAKPVSLTIKATAKKVAQSEAVEFYRNSGDTSHALVNLTTVSGAVTGDGATATPVVVTFDGGPKVTGRIGQFYPGMLVDIIDSSDSPDTPLNTTPMVVTAVDYIARQLTIHTVSGSALAAAIADGDYITLKDAYVTTGSPELIVASGPSGLNTWIVNSGTVFGISMTTHPQFKSLITAVNNVLDQAVLDTNVGAFFDAYADVCDLDTFITTAGVVNNYIENTEGLWRYERHGTGALKLKEGWSSFDYEHNGRSFDVLTSRYCTNGHLYGIKSLEQNLKRYVPPKVPGAGKKEGFANEIQWFAPLVGSKSIFLPAYSSSGGITRYLQAPFFCQREICPEQMQGIKLTGLTELFV
jgi:hypothetical protein